METFRINHFENLRLFHFNYFILQRSWPSMIQCCWQHRTSKLSILMKGKRHRNCSERNIQRESHAKRMFMSYEARTIYLFPIHTIVMSRKSASIIGCCLLITEWVTNWLILKKHCKTQVGQVFVTRFVLERRLHRVIQRWNSREFPIQQRI